jgi:hypothetical protein
MIRETLAELRRTGHEFHRPWFLYLLAEAHAAGSEFEEALTQIEEALAVLGNTTPSPGCEGAVVAPLVLDGPITRPACRAYLAQFLVPALQPGDVVAFGNQHFATVLELTIQVSARRAERWRRSARRAPPAKKEAIATGPSANTRCRGILSPDSPPFDNRSAGIWQTDDR